MVFLNCWMGEHIRPEGWSIWQGTENHRTSSYAECGSRGPGAKRKERAGWTSQLSPEAAKQFLPSVFLAGTDQWGAGGEW